MDMVSLNDIDVEELFDELVEDWARKSGKSIPVRGGADWKRLTSEYLLMLDKKAHE